jgi:hypothetical protein
VRRNDDTRPPGDHPPSPRVKQGKRSGARSCTLRLVAFSTAFEAAQGEDWAARMIAATTPTTRQTAGPDRRGLRHDAVGASPCSAGPETRTKWGVAGPEGSRRMDSVPVGCAGRGPRDIPLEPPTVGPSSAPPPSGRRGDEAPGRFLGIGLQGDLRGPPGSPGAGTVSGGSRAPAHDVGIASVPRPGASRRRRTSVRAPSQISFIPLRTIPGGRIQPSRSPLVSRPGAANTAGVGGVRTGRIACPCSGGRAGIGSVRPPGVARPFRGDTFSS